MHVSPVIALHFILKSSVSFSSTLTDRLTNRRDRRQVCSNTCLRSIDCIATRLMMSMILTVRMAEI